MIVLRKEYNFSKMKAGSVKRVPLGEDGRDGIRALTAAYAFARRYNAKVRRKAEHIKFAGRLKGRTMCIHRVA